MSDFEDEVCFVVSLYGAALDAADIVPLMADAIEFLRSAGQPPSHLSVTGRGFGKKPLLFPRAWKRMQKATPGQVQSASVLRFVVGWDNQLCDWNAVCSIYPRSTYFHLGASLAVMPDAEQQIVAFTRRHLTRIRPGYGIGFFRRRGLGPSLYGVGLSYGQHAYSGPEYEEGVAITRWLSGGFSDAVFNNGLLRDVYPYNLLTDRQLERDIDGRSLRAWIRAGRTRGRLHECREGYTLWTVDPGRVEALRQQLIPSGALHCWPPES